jgi:predicted MFS family arabinose efflux permease
VRDTSQHVKRETTSSDLPLLKNVTTATTWGHKNLSSVTQAGFVNNLNDAMVWGILPIVLIDQGYSLRQVGVIAALYPFVWGSESTVYRSACRSHQQKETLVLGYVNPGLSILLFLVANSVFTYAAIAVVLGIGTAVVYPTFLAAIAENVHPKQRAEALGTFRFWRDFGYVAGAVTTGVLSDLLGNSTAILFVGLLTMGSAVILLKRMYFIEKPLPTAVTGSLATITFL